MLEMEIENSVNGNVDDATSINIDEVMKVASSFL
jgi:hypothetical protein